MKDVYQLSDLSSRALLDAGAEKPARLAVLGHPIKHSASPAMHQAALDAFGEEVRYIRLDIEPGKIAEAVERMRQLEFIGCNITVPHKLEVMDVCDSLTDDAKALGAVNTLIFKDQITGDNTDAPGFVRAIQEDFGKNLSELRVMILGAGGGAGRAIATQCSRMGCPRIYLVNRTVSKIEAFAHQLKNAQTLASDSDEIPHATEEVDLIINATSLGLRAEDPLPLPASSRSPQHMIYDMVYNPAQTPLLQEASRQGAKTANGLSMLLHQGVIAYQHWFPSTEPLPYMRKGLLSTQK